MPLLPSCKIERISQKIPIKFDLGLSKHEKWLTWMYCGIVKSARDKSQPEILTCFRKLDTYRVSDEIIPRRVPLTALGFFRIGSILSGNTCKSVALFEEVKFNVKFRQNEWRFNSFFTSTKKESPPPYPFSLYPLMYQSDKNWFIEFNFTKGGKLVIPCIEFFSQCYGHSAELKRILATYPLGSGCQKEIERLYLTEDKPEKPGHWEVTLGAGLKETDAVFVSHFKYDPYTQVSAKSIYAQIETQYQPEKQSPIFIQVPPWFQGEAQLTVRGIWFDKQRSFLGLQITGFSNPTGPTIINNKSSISNDGDPSEKNGGKKAKKYMPERVKTKSLNSIKITGNEAPHNDSPVLEIPSLELKILGKPRKVVKKRIHNSQVQIIQPRKSKNQVQAFSGGDYVGTDKNIGKASIYSFPVMESKGHLNDVWNSLCYLLKKHPEVIQALDWFTFEHGFNRAEKPKLIGFKPFKESDRLTGEIKHWPFLDPHRRQHLRGILVLRVQTTNQKTVYIVEIQRRQYKKDTESFSGIVFSIETKNDFTLWLMQLLSKIRFTQGVAKKLIKTCPGPAATFKHVPSSNETVPCENAAINALRKMGVTIKG